MQYLTHRPTAPLNEFVDYLWLVTEVETIRKERILPNTTIELVINLNEDQIRIYDPIRLEERERLSGALMSGTCTKPFACDFKQHEARFGVHFKPGGAFPFLGVTASCLADSHTDLKDLWGSAATELRERLCRATRPGERFLIAERFLTERLRRGVSRHPAVMAALGFFASNGQTMSVREAAAHVGFSHRHFIKLFTEQVGLPPKVFCRLVRFQRALTIAQSGAFSWSDLAHECGYFDQSHLNHDFQEFSFIAPSGVSEAYAGDLFKNQLTITA